MVKRVWVAMALMLALTACGERVATREVPELTQLWSTPGFANPESVLPNADGTFLYVSNVNGEGEVHDGNGFISRMAPGGEILELEWAKGLDAPKGLALADGRLYVADIDKLVVLDAASGGVLARIAVDGAKFLNDVAVAPDGTVLMADSATARIFALKNGAVSVWLADPKLESVNGLLATPSELYVTTMEGLLLTVAWDSKAISTFVGGGLGQADGVALLDDRLLVSEWPGRLFVVDRRADMRAETLWHSRVLLDTREKKILLNDFVLVGSTLYVPNWEPGTVTAYHVLR